MANNKLFHAIRELFIFLSITERGLLFISNKVNVYKVLQVVNIDVI